MTKGRHQTHSIRFEPVNIQEDYRANALLIGQVGNI